MGTVSSRSSTFQTLPHSTRHSRVSEAEPFEFVSHSDASIDSLSFTSARSSVASEDALFHPWLEHARSIVEDVSHPALQRLSPSDKTTALKVMAAITNLVDRCQSVEAELVVHETMRRALRQPREFATDSAQLLGAVKLAIHEVLRAATLPRNQPTSSILPRREPTDFSSLPQLEFRENALRAFTTPIGRAILQPIYREAVNSAIGTNASSERGRVFKEIYDASMQLHHRIT